MKYQIFGPTGNKVCVIEALACDVCQESLQFWNSTDTNVECIFRLPGTWAAIPLEFIKN